MRYYLLLIASGLVFFSCTDAVKEKKENVESDSTQSEDSVVVLRTPAEKKTTRDVLFFDNAPIIDGDSVDEVWANAGWNEMKYNWLGGDITPEDFSGKFKLGWDDSKLYLLVEVIDDTVMDVHAPWDSSWWKDDCVEIFIDEDNSKGEHQFNYNAFAYHVGLNYDVVDLGPDEKPHLFNKHLTAKRVENGNVSVWEFAIDIYNDSYKTDVEENEKVTLTEGKKIGFMLAYCDNDHSEDRENFIGSEFISGEESERDRGWKDAGEFGTLILKK